MQHAHSYQTINHPDDGGDPIGDAFGAELDRIKYAQEAFDFLIAVADSDAAYNALMDALDGIHCRKSEADRARIEAWWRRKSA